MPEEDHLLVLRFHQSRMQRDHGNPRIQSEAAIQKGMAFLMEGRATFVIVHRLSTIHRAHQVLVVEEGNIVERGTHETLYASRGRYFTLSTRQRTSPSDV